MLTRSILGRIWSLLDAETRRMLLEAFPNEFLGESCINQPHQLCAYTRPVALQSTLLQMMLPVSNVDLSFSRWIGYQHLRSLLLRCPRLKHLNIMACPLLDASALDLIVHTDIPVATLAFSITHVSKSSLNRLFRSIRTLERVIMPNYPLPREYYTSLRFEVEFLGTRAVMDRMLDHNDPLLPHFLRRPCMMSVKLLADNERPSATPDGSFTYLSILIAAMDWERVHKVLQVLQSNFSGADFLQSFHVPGRNSCRAIIKDYPMPMHGFKFIASRKELSNWRLSCLVEDLCLTPPDWTPHYLDDYFLLDITQLKCLVLHKEELGLSSQLVPLNRSLRAFNSELTLFSMLLASGSRNAVLDLKHIPHPQQAGLYPWALGHLVRNIVWNADALDNMAFLVGVLRNEQLWRWVCPRTGDSILHSLASISVQQYQPLDSLLAGEQCMGMFRQVMKCILSMTHEQLSVPNKRGMTPVQLAMAGGFIHFLRFVDPKRDIPSDLRTIMHAASSGSQAVLELALENLDPNKLQYAANAIPRDFLDRFQLDIKAANVFHLLVPNPWALRVFLAYVSRRFAPNLAAIRNSEIKYVNETGAECGMGALDIALRLNMDSESIKLLLKERLTTSHTSWSLWFMHQRQGIEKILSTNANAHDNVYSQNLVQVLHELPIKMIHKVSKVIDPALRPIPLMFRYRIVQNIPKARELMKRILKSDQTDLKTADQDGNTILHLLAELDPTGLFADVCLTSRANLRVANKAGMLPLHLFVENVPEDFDATQYILDGMVKHSTGVSSLLFEMDAKGRNAHLIAVARHVVNKIVSRENDLLSLLEQLIGPQKHLNEGLGPLMTLCKEYPFVYLKGRTIKLKAQEWEAVAKRYIQHSVFNVNKLVNGRTALDYLHDKGCDTTVRYLMERYEARLSRDMRMRDELRTLQARTARTTSGNQLVAQTWQMACRFTTETPGARDLIAVDLDGRTALHHFCRIRPAPPIQQFEASLATLNLDTVSAVLGTPDRNLATPVMISLLMDAVSFSCIPDLSMLSGTLDMISDVSDYLLNQVEEKQCPVSSATNRTAAFMYLLNVCNAISVNAPARINTVCVLIGMLSRWIKYLGLNINLIDQSGCTVLDVLVSQRARLPIECYDALFSGLKTLGANGAIEIYLSSWNEEIESVQEPVEVAKVAEAVSADNDVSMQVDSYPDTAEPVFQQPLVDLSRDLDIVLQQIASNEHMIVEHEPTKDALPQVSSSSSSDVIEKDVDLMIPVAVPVVADVDVEMEVDQPDAVPDAVEATVADPPQDAEPPKSEAPVTHLVLDKIQESEAGFQTTVFRSVHLADPRLAAQQVSPAKSPTSKTRPLSNEEESAFQKMQNSGLIQAVGSLDTEPTNDAVKRFKFSGAKRKAMESDEQQDAAFGQQDIAEQPTDLQPLGDFEPFDDFENSVFHSPLRSIRDDANNPYFGLETRNSSPVGFTVNAVVGASSHAELSPSEIDVSVKAQQELKEKLLQLKQQLNEKKADLEEALKASAESKEAIQKAKQSSASTVAEQQQGYSTVSKKVPAGTKKDQPATPKPVSTHAKAKQQSPSKQMHVIASTSDIKKAAQPSKTSKISPDKQLQSKVAMTNMPPSKPTSAISSTPQKPAAKSKLESVSAKPGTPATISKSSPPKSAINANPAVSTNRATSTLATSTSNPVPKKPRLATENQKQPKADSHKHGTLITPSQTAGLSKTVTTPITWEEKDLRSKLTFSASPSLACTKLSYSSPPVVEPTRFPEGPQADHRRTGGDLRGLLYSRPGLNGSEPAQDDPGVSNRFFSEEAMDRTLKQEPVCERTEASPPDSLVFAMAERRATSSILGEAWQERRMEDPHSSLKDSVEARHAG